MTIVQVQRTFVNIFAILSIPDEAGFTSAGERSLRIVAISVFRAIVKAHPALILVIAAIRSESVETSDIAVVSTGHALVHIAAVVGVSEESGGTFAGERTVVVDTSCI